MLGTEGIHHAITVLGGRGRRKRKKGRENHILVISSSRLATSEDLAAVDLDEDALCCGTAPLRTVSSRLVTGPVTRMMWVLPPPPAPPAPLSEAPPTAPSDLFAVSSSSASSESASALLESVVIPEQLILVVVAVSVLGDWLPESRLSDSLDATGATSCCCCSVCTTGARATAREDWAMAPATVITVVEEEDLSPEPPEETSGEEVEAGADPAPAPEGLLRVSGAARDALLSTADDLGEGFFCLMAFLLDATGDP